VPAPQWRCRPARWASSVSRGSPVAPPGRVVRGFSGSCGPHLPGGPACRRGGRLVPAGSTGLCAASLSATAALGRDPWHQVPAPVCSAPSATALWLSGQRSAPAHDGQACAVAARVPGGALQNHRMVWVGRDPKDHQVPTPLPQAWPPASRSGTRPGCPGLHPTWPRTPPGMEHPHPSVQPVPAPHHSV